MTRLMAKCDSCGGWVQPHAFFIDEGHNLVVMGLCLDCANRVLAPMALRDLYKMSNDLRASMNLSKLNDMVGKEIEKITDEAGKPLRPPLKEGLTKEDKDFLKTFHITEGDNA